MLKSKKSLRFLRWFGIVLTIFLGLLLIGFIYEFLAERADAKNYRAPGKLVDIGGYRLHINCTGKGSPTVVVDAGWGDWSASWRQVQDKVSQNIRVCTYDRAGFGWSDVGPNPRNAKKFAAELHTLLDIAKISSPYILVGHSSGGFTARVFVHEYPAEVSGVVLVDSMSPRQYSTSVMNAHNVSATKVNSPVTLLARFGIIRAFTTVLATIENATHEEKAQYALNSSPKYVQAFLDEGEGLPESAYQASKVTSFGELPVIVLSKGNEDASYKSWNDWQKELLYLSKNSRHMVAQGSGHGIQIEKPEAVIGAINEMIKLVN